MKHIILILLSLIIFNLSAQESKDDPQARFDFELLRLQNPKTKKIPSGVFQKEHAFMEKNFSTNEHRTSSSWINRGPYNVGGRTRALAVDVRDENVILAGGVSGGLWRSVDQGDSWTKVTDANALQSVSCIAQDTRAGHEDTWYYGTGEITGNSAGASGAPYRGDGIFKSTDGGLTWSLLPSTSTNIPESFDHDFDYNYEVVVNRVNGNIIVANYGGISQSEDGGMTFEEILDKPEGTWTDVTVSSSGIIYASIASNGIWESEDNGTNWTEITSEEPSFPRVGGRRKEVALAPGNENILYVIGLDDNHSSGHLLWRYDRSDDFDENGIGNWEDRSNQIPQLGGLTGNFNSQGGYDLLIKVKPDDEDFVIIGGTNLFASTDGFSTTTNTSWIGGYTATNQSYGLYTNQHPDQHSFVFLSEDKALSGNDGGVQLTLDVRDVTENGNNETVDWIWKNNGYLTSQSYAISVGPGDQIMSGFQDNSTWLTTSTDPGFTWTDQYGGDGAYSAFSSDGTTRWMSSQNANIYRVTYPSASSHSPTGFFNFAPASGYSTSLFITPFYLDPIDDNIFYLGGAPSLFVNTEALSGSSTTGWTEIDLGASGVISEIGVTNFNQVILGTSSGQVIKINDPAGDPIITNISGSNLPVGYISGVAVNPYNANEIMICYSNYSIPSVFHTTDGGETWIDISGNLEENSDGSGSGPSVRTAAIIGNGDHYFVGTSSGLFSVQELNGLSTIWVQEDPNNIGSVVVEHFATKLDGFIAAGTHGNGIVSNTYEIQNVLQNDLTVTTISSPVSGVLGEESVEAVVVNSGMSAQNQYDLSLYVNNALVVTDQVTSLIETLDSYTHTFSQQVNFSSAGIYTLRVEVELTGDEETGNNSFEKEIESIVPLSSFPYATSFEDSSDEWTGTGIWERGVPSQTNLSSVSDGNAAWMTDLDGNYPNNHAAVLTSPYFDLTGLTSASISFDINYSIESDWDGVVLGYRTSNSSGFTVLFDDSNTANWYPGNANVFGHNAWQGSTNGSFVEATIDVSFLTTESGVQFAFIFKSDEAVDDEGFALDNFRITSPNLPPTDITLDSDEIMENLSVGALVGTFTTIDVDDAVHSYSLSTSTSADKFSINEDQLLSAEVFDFELETSYTIVVLSEDSEGHVISRPFSINILDDPSDALGIGTMEKNGIKVFPNPVKNTLNLDLINDYFGTVQIEVYSLESGKLIKRMTTEKTTLSLRRLFDINSLQEGLYILNLEMGDKVISGKIIKE